MSAVERGDEVSGALQRMLAAAALLAGASGTHAQAQDWPTRPVIMVNPFAAGGPNDLLARPMAQRMSEILGQQVVIENIGGAGGMTGSQRVAQAAPDGYTFLLGTVGTQAQSQTLYKKPLYNAVTDFKPVTLIAQIPLVLIARKDLPVATFQEFVAYVKANQAKMSFGSAGLGSATHLGCVLLNSAIGVNIQHVPYRGMNPAMQDLIAGRIDYLCEIVTTGLAQIRGGNVKPIAMLALQRASVLKDLPTAHESGLPGFEAYTWNAFFVPKDTPAPIVAKLHEATLAAMKTPALRERLTALGAQVMPDERAAPAYLDGFVKSEIEKWAAPIRASGAVVE
jgi:tripartite-type tricarboxylate transporter receptor subunit TctC